jgi:hypothetical protein
MYVSIIPQTCFHVSATHAVIQEYPFSQAPMTHAYSPNSSGGRDQEDQCSKPFKASPGKQFMRPYFKKNPSQKKRGGPGRVAQGVGPEFRSQFGGKKKKNTLLACDISQSLKLKRWTPRVLSSRIVAKTLQKITFNIYTAEFHSFALKILKIYF